MKTMTESTHIRCYEADKERIKEITSDGSMPSRVRELVTIAEQNTDQ